MLNFPRQQLQFILIFANRISFQIFFGQFLIQPDNLILLKGISILKLPNKFFEINIISLNLLVLVNHNLNIIFQ